MQTLPLTLKRPLLLLLLLLRGQATALLLADRCLGCVNTLETATAPGHRRTCIMEQHNQRRRLEVRPTPGLHPTLCSGLMLLCACKPIASSYRCATAQALRNVQNQYLPTDCKLCRACSGAAWLNLAVALLMQRGWVG
jgi:hypothetical protein